MKTALGITFYGLSNDSRAKRAFSALSEVTKFKALCAHCSDKDSFGYPVETLNVRVSGALARAKIFLLVLIRLFKHKPQVVYAADLSALAAGGVYKLFAKPFLIYDGREIYLKDENGESTYGWQHRLIERLFIKKADQVLAANEERAKIVEKHYNLKKPVIAIHNIPDSTGYRDLPLPEDFSYLHNKEKKFVVYQGHLDKDMRGLRPFFKSVKVWPKYIELIIITQASTIKELKKFFEENEIHEQVHLHDLVDHEMLYSILKKCHLGVIAYSNYGLNNKLCAPNKLYEYAQCNLPVLTTSQPVFKRIFSKYKIGKMMGQNDIEGKNFMDLLSYKSGEYSFAGFNRENNWGMDAKKISNIIENFK